MRWIKIWASLFVALASVTHMEGQGRPVGILTYPHIKAETEALACSDDIQAAECKSYFAGFAQMLDLLLATDESTKDYPKGLCGDLTDLVPEFINAGENRA